MVTCISTMDDDRPCRVCVTIGIGYGKQNGVRLIRKMGGRELGIKYVHTNIIAKDWKKLSKFYIDVFECEPQYPERDLSGEWIETMTNIDNVKIRGIHLSLPGYDNGPTLEIFEFEPKNLKNNESVINEQGFGHIAFHVDVVEEVVEKLVEHGGKVLGRIINMDYEDIGKLTAVYAQDPEGNFIEIQNWSK